MNPLNLNVNVNVSLSETTLTSLASLLNRLLPISSIVADETRMNSVRESEVTFEVADVDVDGSV